MTSNPRVLDAALDAAIRFREHGAYGSEARAVDAVARRTSAPREDCREALRAFCLVLGRAVGAIERHRRAPAALEASPGDIDLDACMAELDEVEPGAAIEHKRQMLDWAIYWHYLK